MKITKQKVLELNTGLKNVSELGGARFAYAVARNIAKIKSEVESVIVAQSRCFGEYEKERKALAESHATKVDGKPKIVNDSYVIEDQAKFDKEIKIIQDKYKPAEDEFTALLKEEFEVDLHIIPNTYFPDTITANQISGIMLMIEEKETN